MATRRGAAQATGRSSRCGTAGPGWPAGTTCWTSTPYRRSGPGRTWPPAAVGRRGRDRQDHLAHRIGHYAAARGARSPGDGAGRARAPPGYWPWVQVMRALGLDTPLSAAGLSTTGLSTTGAGRARPARDREPHVVAARPDRDAGAGGQARLLGDQAERARKTVTARIRAGRRAERFRGTPDLPAYFRQPCGPGWALVGDAGLLLDPITGQGIGHAFRDAELRLTRSPTASAGSVRWARRSGSITGPATRPPGRCTTSPPGSPRSTRRPCEDGAVPGPVPAPGRFRRVRRHADRLGAAA